MGKAKIAVTLADDMVKKVDRLVARRVYPNRSRAIEEALAEKLERLERPQLAEECSKLDPAFEKALADGDEVLISVVCWVTARGWLRGSLPGSRRARLTHPARAANGPSVFSGVQACSVPMS